jgi:hypothetical protein
MAEWLCGRLQPVRSRFDSYWVLQTWGGGVVATSEVVSFVSGVRSSDVPPILCSHRLMVDRCVLNAEAGVRFPVGVPNNHPVRDRNTSLELSALRPRKGQPIYSRVAEW